MPIAYHPQYHVNMDADGNTAEPYQKMPTCSSNAGFSIPGKLLHGLRGVSGHCCYAIGGGGESMVIFVGDQEAGRTSLIQAFLNPSRGTYNTCTPLIVHVPML